MEYIDKYTKDFIRTHLKDNIARYGEIISETKMRLSEIDNQLDKTKFLSGILSENNIMYSEHLKYCKNLDGCPQNYAHDSINYFLTQEINRLGIKTDDNLFTKQEIDIINDKLDQILKDQDELKKGQEVIYDGLLEDINELKELYFLGKKNWYQLFYGKCLEMTISGVVSETVSKEIVKNLIDLKKTLISLS